MAPRISNKCVRIVKNLRTRYHTPTKWSISLDFFISHYYSYFIFFISECNSYSRSCSRTTSVLFTTSLNSHLEADIYRKIELTREMEADAIDSVSYIHYRLCCTIHCTLTLAYVPHTHVCIPEHVFRCIERPQLQWQPHWDDVVRSATSIARPRP